MYTTTDFADLLGTISVVRYTESSGQKGFGNDASYFDTAIKKAYKQLVIDIKQHCQKKGIDYHKVKYRKNLLTFGDSSSRIICQIDAVLDHHPRT